MAVEQQFSEETEIAGTLQDLIDAAAETVHVPSQTSISRKAQIAQALDPDNLDLDELIALQEKLEKVIDRILDNQINVEDTSTLSEDELRDYMREALEQADVKRLLEIRYQMMRTRVFSHITEVHRTNGVADPEHTPGEAIVPAFRKRFTREGGKVKNVLDHCALREALGPERWEQVVHVEVIPEHTETHLSETALLALVREDPKVLEIVRQCVVPGGYGVARFHIRNLEEK